MLGLKLYTRYLTQQNPSFFDGKGLRVSNLEQKLEQWYNNERTIDEIWSEEQQKQLMKSFTYVINSVCKGGTFTPNSEWNIRCLWLGLYGKTIPVDAYRIKTLVSFYKDMGQEPQRTLAVYCTKEEREQLEQSWQQFIQENKDIFQFETVEKDEAMKDIPHKNISTLQNEEYPQAIHLLIDMIGYAKYEASYLIRCVCKWDTEHFNELRTKVNEAKEKEQSVDISLTSFEANALLCVAYYFGARCFTKTTPRKEIENCIFEKPVRIVILAQCHRVKDFIKEYFPEINATAPRSLYVALTKKPKETKETKKVNQAKPPRSNQEKYEETLHWTIEDCLEKGRKSPQVFFKQLGRYLQAVQSKGPKNVKRSQYIKK